MTLLTIILTLFLIMNPFGNMKYFLELLEDLKPRRQYIVIAREMLLALVAMLFFSFLGERIAAIFQLSHPTIYLSSGIILFLTAIKILFPKDEYQHPVYGEEPFLVPIAIPIIASPALLAMIMLYSHAEPLILPMVISILSAWVLSSIILLRSRQILRILRRNGLLAIERLMGMVLVLIAVQRFLEGVILFIAHK